ncbi:hypothetical protein V6N13_113593 [Hibiscus sabdariffa]|uniref:Uncharacterized protein n=1 Tax=Hibiscus sabdariffa TaxID=183260 RepID=A0ABR2TZ67_9ROSI
MLIHRPLHRNKVDPSGDWDWQHLSECLPTHILQHLAIVQPPQHHMGKDTPGWRWVFSSKSAYSALNQVWLSNSEWLLSSNLIASGISWQYFLLNGWI